MALEVNLVTFEILSFFNIFGRSFNNSMRKRKRILRSDAYAKRRVNIYSLDLRKLELKRIVNFHIVFYQSSQHDAFFGNSQFWRQPRLSGN